MKRWLRNLLVALGVLVALLAGAWFYLTAREAVPETSTFALDLGEARRLAFSLPGPLPTEVRSELVADSALPRGAVFAGESFAPHPMVHQVFQVVYPTGFVIIDSAYGIAMHEATGSGRPYHADGWKTVQRALAHADHIVFTHEHGDHIDGAARHEPPEEIASRVRFNRAQLENTARLDEVQMPEALRRTTPIDYDRMHALAPGVVLIAAPGHTPGNQLVFVLLEDGRELLFIGDVAWHMDALRNLHYRPRLVTDWFLGEDRAAVLAQFRTLHDLLESDPKVQIVVSHDPDQRAELLRTGAIVDGFALAAP